MTTKTSPEPIGFVNVYREPDGTLSVGSSDAYETAEEAADGSAVDFITSEEYVGVFALVPVEGFQRP